LEINYISNSSKHPKCQLILAHGAGAGMNHEFMESISQALVKLDIHVIRFNFSYIDEGKKLPRSPTKSIANWNEIIKIVENQNPELPLFIGGKSYGGRMASHSLLDNPANQEIIKGIIYLGFPLHALGKPSIKKGGHLDLIPLPQLFLQGTKDKLADIELIQHVADSLSKGTIAVFENADHSFHVPKKFGGDTTDRYEKLAETINQWILSQLK